jgi:hypothetical protein
MSSGFMVDLTALVKAAEGINGTIAAVSSDKVSGIVGSQACYGNDALASIHRPNRVSCGRVNAKGAL